MFSPLDSTEKKTCTQMQLSNKHFPHDFFNTIKKGTRKVAQWGKLSLCKKEAQTSEPSHAHAKAMGLAMGAYNPSTRWVETRRSWFQWPASLRQNGKHQIHRRDSVSSNKKEHTHYWPPDSALIHTDKKVHPHIHACTCYPINSS